MANRTVAVSLTAQVSSYISGFKQAEQATRSTGDAAEDAQKKFQNQNAAMTQVGVGLVAFGAIAAAAVGLAVAKYAEFDEAMSAVQAATHESADNMALLRDAAIDAGSSTVFTAKEAANAIEELAKAGLTTAEILGGALNGALNLAAASGIGVAEAAEIASKTLNQFNLEGSESEHVADLLAAGAGKASGEVTDLGEALAQVGQVANGAGLTIEETTTALAAFASQGLIGSDAGTAFKTMLGALTPNSAKAADEMERLGLSAYDANGNFVGLEEYAGRVRDAFSGLTPEARSASMEIIFGSDAVRAATSLYNEGAEGIADWSAKVDDSGYAAETAALRLDNLNGDIEKLGGAFDSVLIKTGSGANDALRLLVQTATGLVDAFGEAPPLIQQGALALTAVAAAAALAGGAFLIGVPKIAEFSVAMNTLSQSSIPAVAAAATRAQTATTRLGAGFSSVARFLGGPWGIALAAAGVALAALNAQIQAGVPTAEEIDNALKNAANSADLLRVASTRSGAEQFIWGDYADSLKDIPALLDKVNNDGFDFFNLSFNEQGAVDSLKRVGDQLAALAATDLPAAQHQFTGLTESLGLNEKQQYTLLESMSGYKEALVAQANEMGINVTTGSELENQQALLALANEGTAASTEIAAQSYSDAAQTAADLRQQIIDLIDTVNQSNSVGQDAVTANSAYQDSLAQVDEYIRNLREGTEGYSSSLDETTAAGAANAAMFVQMASDSQAAAAAQFALDGNTANYRSTLEAGRAALIDRITQLTGNADAAAQLADKIYAIPTERQFTMIAETAAANQRIAEVIAMINSVPASRRTSIGVTVETDEIFRVQQKAAGGAIYGPGGPRDDKVPALLSNGEHVLTASDVAALGGQAGVYAFRAGLHGGQGYANGGSVGSRVSVSPNVSLAGARIVLDIGGQQFEGFVRDQIAVADSARGTTVGAGWRV